MRPVGEGANRPLTTLSSALPSKRQISPILLITLLYMYTLAHAKVRRIGAKLIKSQEKGAEMHFFKVFI
jgi:hypothetical protein